MNTCFIAWSRKRAILALLPIAALIGAVWWLVPRPPLHERNYNQLEREFSWKVNAMLLRSRTPAQVAPMIPLDIIESTLRSRSDALVQKLILSRFFTNVVLPIPGLAPSATNESVIMAEVHRRLTNTAAPVSGYMSYSVGTTNLHITCRTSDLPIVKAAINSP